MKKNKFTRRSAIKGVAATGALSLFGYHLNNSSAAAIKNKPQPTTNVCREKIFKKVLDTPFINTHEHLINENERFMGIKHPNIKCDDWAFLFYHYTSSDILSAGMSKKDHEKFFSPKTDPLKKWPLLEPYWPLIKNTGYAQAVQLTIKELYGINEISKETIPAIQKAYKETIKPGFYKKVLLEKAKIKS